MVLPGFIFTIVKKLFVINGMDTRKGHETTGLDFGGIHLQYRHGFGNVMIISSTLHKCYNLLMFVVVGLARSGQCSFVAFYD
jgi:hypothetical protein